MSNLRSQVIRLASEHPDLRGHLLPLLKVGMEFDTQDALDKYLKEHPDADKSNHSVKKQTEDRGNFSDTLSKMEEDKAQKALDMPVPNAPHYTKDPVEMYRHWRTLRDSLSDAKSHLSPNNPKLKALSHAFDKADAAYEKANAKHEAYSKGEFVIKRGHPKTKQDLAAYARSAGDAVTSMKKHGVPAADATYQKTLALYDEWSKASQDISKRVH